MESNRTSVVNVGIIGIYVVGFFLLIAMTPVALAQTPKSPPTAASYSDTYCSGFIAEGEISRTGVVMGAEEGRKKNELVTGDLVYLGDGAMSNLQKGQEVFIIRPLRKIKNLGTLYSDIAHVRIVDIHGETPVGEIVFSCQSLVVGDWVIAPQSRLSPPARPTGPVDRFSPTAGKAEGQIIDSKWHVVQLGQSAIIYLNVGTNHGVQAGSVLRIYRPASEGALSVYSREFYTKASNTARFPRQFLGECVVLQSEESSSTAIITTSREEIALGDRVDLQ
ncbi:MAG: hypothetical protein ACHQKY_12190 [Terriglobia bacterium]